MIRIYEGVIYRQNFKKSPFRKDIEQMFALGQKHKDKGNNLMQGLVKFNNEDFIGSSNSKRD